jgi:hypothetical protein
MNEQSHATLIPRHQLALTDLAACKTLELSRLW